MQFRNPVRSYFWALLQALLSRLPEPPVPELPSAEVNRRLKEATAAIRESYSSLYVT